MERERMEGPCEKYAFPYKQRKIHIYKEKAKIYIVVKWKGFEKID